MRCFIAIELPGNVKSKIFHEFEILKEKNLFDGKFENKESIHLTLKFLGELTKEQVNEIVNQLKEIDFPEFKCSIGRSGFFDNERRIKIIWVEIISDMILKLEKEISGKFLETKTEEKFSPHITVARVKYVKDRKGLIENIKNVHLKNLNFDVSEFVLMKSELTPKGSNYKVLERFKLK